MTDHQKSVMEALKAMAEAASFGASEHAQTGPQDDGEDDHIRDLAQQLSTEFHRTVTARLIMAKVENDGMRFSDTLLLILGTAINFLEISTYQAAAMLKVNRAATQEELDDLRGRLLKDIDMVMRAGIAKGLDATGKAGDRNGSWF